jgi:phenylacetate-CoA ligase
MQAKELPIGHGPTVVHKSSGSTGTPIETTHNRLEGVAGNAAMLRSYRWHDIDFDKSLLDLIGEDPNVGAWPDGMRRGRWGPPWAEGNGARYELNKFTTPEQTADFLAAGKFSYFSAMPSRIEPVAYVLHERGKRLKLDALFLRGESVTVTQRRLFNEIFEAACVDLYAATEAFKIGNNCAAYDHYHVNAELGIVEIVGEDGAPVERCQPGQVVVTPFYNTAQPLVRYAIGDIAVAGEPCSCGRTLPVIGKLIGRTYHTFQTSDGRRFTPVVQEDETFDLGIGMWQLAQIASNVAEFRYVPRPGLDPDATELEAILRRGLPSSFQIKLSPREHFASRGDHKHILLVNELDATTR